MKLRNNYHVGCWAKAVKEVSRKVGEFNYSKKEMEVLENAVIQAFSSSTARAMNGEQSDEVVIRKGHFQVTARSGRDVEVISFRKIV